MAALIDSNVLIDVLTEPSRWQEWSAAQLAEWVQRGPLLINDIIYAEVSVGYDERIALDAELADMGIESVAMSREALFDAGKAFLSYRRQAGVRGAILPDFIIAAHAAVLGIPLITRDRGPFKSCFPQLSLVTP